MNPSLVLHLVWDLINKILSLPLLFLTAPHHSFLMCSSLKKRMFLCFLWLNEQIPFLTFFSFFFFPTICLKHRKLEKVKRCDVKATLYSEIHSMIAKGISKQSFFKFFKNRCQKAHTYCTYGLRVFLILIFMSLPKPHLS